MEPLDLNPKCPDCGADVGSDDTGYWCETPSCGAASWDREGFPR